MALRCADCGGTDWFGGRAGAGATVEQDGETVEAGQATRVWCLPCWRRRFGGMVAVDGVAA